MPALKLNLSSVSDDKYTLSGLVVWMAIMFIYPVVGETLDIWAILSGMLFVLGAWSTGILLLHPIESINSRKGIVKDGIAIFLGAMALFWIYFCLPWIFGPTVFFVVVILLLITTVWLNKVGLACKDPSSWIAIATVLIFFAFIQDNSASTLRALSVEPIQLTDHWDFIFFTSVVASMKHGTLEAIYEVGAPMNYQILGFCAPAALSAMANISSHVSLWGCCFANFLPYFINFDTARELKEEIYPMYGMPFSL